MAELVYAYASEAYGAILGSSNLLVPTTGYSIAVVYTLRVSLGLGPQAQDRSATARGGVAEIFSRKLSVTVRQLNKYRGVVQW